MSIQSDRTMLWATTDSTISVTRPVHGLQENGPRPSKVNAPQKASRKSKVLPSMVCAAVLLSSFGSSALPATPVVQLPPGVKQQLTHNDGPFFERVGCTEGATRTEFGTHSSYQTIQLKQYTCIGNSLETHVCGDGVWTLTEIQCPAGLVETQQR